MDTLFVFGMLSTHIDTLFVFVFGMLITQMDAFCVWHVKHTNGYRFCMRHANHK